MCIPQPQAPQYVTQAPAPDVPTMQAATALQLGGPNGVPRGAAALGRLQLRIPGAGTGQQGNSPAAPTGGQQPSPPAGGSQPSAPSPSTQGTGGLQTYSGVTNKSLYL